MEQRDLGRVLAPGANSFERMVGLSVLARNLHRIGLVLRLKRKRAARPLGENAP